MEVKGELLKILTGKKEYKAEKLYSEKEFSDIISKLDKKKYENYGIEIFNSYQSKKESLMDELKSSFVNLFKVLFFYLKGDGIGLFNTEEYRQGFVRIVENSPLPKEIIKGIIKGLIKHFGLKGSFIKEGKSRLEGDKYDEYFVSWLVSHV